MTSNPRLLIVDDDRTVCQSLKLLFTTRGFDARYIINPMNVLDFIRSFVPDVVILDMNFTITSSGDQGLRILGDIRKNYPELPVILITAWGTLELAVAGMKAGAVDFLTKPWENEHILSAVTTQISLRQAETKNRYSYLDNIIGESPSVRAVKSLILQVAPTEATVLLTGESGTGKELVAEAIHDLSVRKDKPFVKVNLGGIPNELFESELFGHKKGAFTGAVADREGRFQKVGEGTIFLDEIGDLSLPSQVKLLRVLQEKTFEPLGSSTTFKTRARVISATHRDLHEMMETGRFREDLYYRINLLNIHLPSLSERREDIPLLARSFVENLSRDGKRRKVEDSALEWLSTQDFPGNIRQLRNLVERTCLLSGNNAVTIRDFKANGAAQPGKFRSADLTLEEMEKQMIAKAIEVKKGNMSEVARRLGITRSALYRRMNKYNLLSDED